MFRLGLIALGGMVLVGCSRASKPATPILVSAASSLTEAMKDVGSAFEKEHPNETVRFNFGASGALAKQIEQGAPVDVFVSAGEKEMDEVAKAGKLTPNSRMDVAGNLLVLVGPLHSPIRTWEDLLKPTVKRIALPKPDLVPSGRYGKETLEHRSLWKEVSKKLVLAQNVKQALQYVESGDVDAGVVFITDANYGKSMVKIIKTAKPGVDCSPIDYPAAVIQGGPNSTGAAQFNEYLASPAGRDILRRYGFSSPDLKP